MHTLTMHTLLAIHILAGAPAQVADAVGLFAAVHR